MISRSATKLGSLKALVSFFKKLERLGVGTRRAELMTKDITWQNVLKSESELLKSKGIENQERDIRTVRIILRAMRERVEENMLAVKRWMEKTVTDRVLAEKKMIGGGRHRKLKQRARRICEGEYGRKWREELEERGKYLTLRYGRVKLSLIHI